AVGQDARWPSVRTTTTRAAPGDEPVRPAARRIAAGRSPPALVGWSDEIALRIAAGVPPTTRPSAVTSQTLSVGSASLASEAPAQQVDQQRYCRADAEQQEQRGQERHRSLAALGTASLTTFGTWFMAAAAWRRTLDAAERQRARRSR